MDILTFVEYTITKTDEAIEQFGSYTFFDKGASEVMDMGELKTLLKTMSAEDAGEAIRILALTDDDTGRYEQIAAELVGECQEWDDLFDQPFIRDVLDW